MAYKPQKGRFKYNLATVLRIRKIMEKREQKAYQERIAALEAERQKEREIREFQNAKLNELADQLSGKIEDFSAVLRRQAYLGKVKVDVMQQEQKTVEAEQLKEEQREKLVKAVMDRKIMEKDRAHKRVKWQKFMKKEETKFLDDIATSRFFNQ